MTLWQWGLIALTALALIFATSAATLALIKRKTRRLADHAPKCITVCRALIDDPWVAPLDKLKLRAFAGYLSLPLDLIPDFIPIFGRLDDALIVALAIRTAIRSADPDLIRQHWPSSEPPPGRILRAATGKTRSRSASASAAL